MEKVVIVGGGLVGSLHAIMMARKGFEVEVFERRPDIRNVELAAGRSINLACSNRGWAALEAADMDEEIRTISIPMYGRSIHATDGTISNQPYGLEGEAIYSVSRGDLNLRLIRKAAEFPNVQLYFNEKCLDVDLDTNDLKFQNTKNNRRRTIQANRIFATDGAFSAVRNRMMRIDRFNYSQYFLKHGYKELLLPTNEDGTHKLNKNALHIWPRGGFMLIALPNLDGSFTCTMFNPFEGENSFGSLKTRSDVTRFFRKEFPDFFEIMPEVEEEYFRNPTSSLVVVRCEPWNYKDQILLLGDAAHAIVPFYGQGMNAGFEDVRIFSEMHDSFKGDCGVIFKKFAELRKPDGDAIADLALKNFVEMRDLVGDEKFLLRKKIEKKLFEAHPDKWLPQYSQVTFSHIRYSEAWKAGLEQDAVMEKVMNMDGIENKWDSDEVMRDILNQINEK
jgi:kynurenine 3-monooxygenase